MTSDLELDLVGIALYMSGYTVRVQSQHCPLLFFPQLRRRERERERHTFGIFPSANLDELLDV